jgi:hypothetical protein
MYLLSALYTCIYIFLTFLAVKKWFNWGKLSHFFLVDNAYGITVDICGPTSLRRSDLHLLLDSAINARLALLQADDEEQFGIFGDSAYPKNTHLRTYHDHSRAWCAAMKKVRISIEWNYATTGALFKYIALPWKLRLMKSPNVAKVFTVCTILKNCHAILYGNQTSNYFNVSLPDGFIDYYVNQEDLP